MRFLSERKANHLAAGRISRSERARKKIRGVYHALTVEVYTGKIGERERERDSVVACNHQLNIIRHKHSVEENETSENNETEEFKEPQQQVTQETGGKIETRIK